VFWKLFGQYFSAIFPLFSVFLVKHPVGGSGCPDDKVNSSGRPFSLSGRACLCDLLRGTTTERHLSFVRTVNPVGLYRIPPSQQPPRFIFFFCFFCHLVRCFLAFHVCFSRALVLFAIYLQSRYVSLPFYCIIFKFLYLK
jgi:hypothetical protein